jgi:hypothetical protein
MAHEPPFDSFEDDSPVTRYQKDMAGLGAAPTCPDIAKWVVDNIPGGFLAPKAMLNRVADTCCGKIDTAHALSTLGLQISTDSACNESLHQFASFVACAYATGSACLPCCEVAGSFAGRAVNFIVAPLVSAVRETVVQLLGAFSSCDYDPRFNALVAAATAATSDAATKTGREYMRLRSSLGLPMIWPTGTSPGTHAPVDKAFKVVPISNATSFEPWERLLYRKAIRYCSGVNSWQHRHTLAGAKVQTYNFTWGIPDTPAPINFWGRSGVGRVEWKFCCAHPEKWGMRSRRLFDDRTAAIGQATQDLIMEVAVAAAEEDQRARLTRLAKLGVKVNPPSPQKVGTVKYPIPIRPLDLVKGVAARRADAASSTRDGAPWATLGLALVAAGAIGTIAIVNRRAKR